MVIRYQCNEIYDELHYTSDESALRNEGYEDEERKLSEVVVDYSVPRYIKHKAEKKCGWCQRSNRQESLFPCGRFGICLIRFEFQLILSSSILAFIALVWYEAVDINNNGHWAIYILLGITILLYLLIILYIIPVCIRRFMLVTNVISSHHTIDRDDER